MIFWLQKFGGSKFLGVCEVKLMVKSDVEYFEGSDGFLTSLRVKMNPKRVKVNSNLSKMIKMASNFHLLPQSWHWKD